MTPERRAEIESMLDSDRYSFSYGGYIGGLAGDDETHDEPANAIIRELLTALDGATARAAAVERVVEAVRLVGGLDNESSGYAIAARMRAIAHALTAYDATRGGSE